jgi:hypothetical protein
MSEFVRRKEKTRGDIAAAAGRADPLDSASLEALIEEIETFEGAALDEKSQAFELLRARVSYGNRGTHIDAIVGTRNLNLFAKNELLKAAKEAWLADSPSSLGDMSDVGHRLVGIHADELMGSNWGFNWELNKLASFTGADRTTLAIDLAAAATSRGLEAAATTWLNIASIIAPSADADVPKRAFERLLDDGAARLADEVGDGPWRDELDPGADPSAVAAGLIWFCLGSPEAKSRWRAAHVVRECARRGRWPIVAKLFELLDAKDAGAFQDRKLSFFQQHARLWFLLAVARMALDHPNEIKKFSAPLEAIAWNEAFPHVGLRKAAVRALSACLGKAKTAAAKDMRRRLATVNVSRFPKPKKTIQVPGSLWSRPDDAPEPEPRFNFEYDFEKYKVAGLGRLFGLPQWQAADKIVGWVRTMSPDTPSMYEFAGRRKPSGRENFKEGTDERFHCYGTYLAWHALQLSGGAFLLERPIARSASYEEAWEEWLSQFDTTRSDGFWLSDGVESYPPRACDDLLDGDAKDTSPTAETNILLKLAGISPNQLLDEAVLVSGAWNSPDGVHVDISSALVPYAHAELAAIALATAPERQMYISVVRAFGDEDEDFRSEDDEPCQPWIARREAYSKLDKFDPHGSEAAIERDRLTMEANTKFSLSSEDAWSATWKNAGGGIAYTAEAWGVRRGEGSAERVEEGTTVVCRTKFLSEVLEKSGCSLLLLVKLELYIDKDRFGGETGSAGKFVHTATTAVIDRLGHVEIIEPAEADAETIRKLDDHLAYRLKDRFAALSKVRMRSNPAQ